MAFPFLVTREVTVVVLEAEENSLERRQWMCSTKEKRENKTRNQWLEMQECSDGLRKGEDFFFLGGGLESQSFIYQHFGEFFCRLQGFLFSSSFMSGRF